MLLQWMITYKTSTLVANNRCPNVVFFTACTFIEQKYLINRMQRCNNVDGDAINSEEQTK